MAVHDFRSQRLHVDHSLGEGEKIGLDRDQANYLINVLRMSHGSILHVFNGREGEWRARVEPLGRKKCQLVVETQIRVQTPPYTLTYCFAPLKQARLDYMMQKAVEMGCGVLQPVITRHTQVHKVNLNRIRANAIEAAEQCGILNIPDIREPVPLTKLEQCLDPGHHLVFCDEEAPESRGLEKPGQADSSPVALLIGPEGGFSQEERDWLASLDNVSRLGLGPRILRADTAAVAAMAVIQATIGDWYDHEQS